MIDTVNERPASNLAQRALIALVRGYRLLFSAWLGNACRFEPTCSRYALEALERHGAAGGTYLALRRLSRCHPWCPGGFDPVPAILAYPTRRRSRASLRDAADLPTP